MKVLHLISGGDGGGAKTHVLSLLQMLSRTETVRLVCFREGPFSREAEELGIPTEVFPSGNVLRTFLRLKRYVREGGFDLIHCHGSRANMMGVLLKTAAKLPVVTTVHSDYRLDYLGRPFHRLTYGTINSIALRLLDYRIGVSDSMVDLLISRGFRPDRLFAIYNGLDFDLPPVREDRRAFWESVGLRTEAGSVVVGIAARLNPVKDVSTLIRGFAKAAEQYPPLRLLIAGDGEEMGMLRELARSLGVAGKVCFAGWVSDMDRFYRSIDINTLTSLSETFPYAVTEGARMKLPTVSTRVGGVPKLIDHGVNGFLFSPGDPDTLAEYLLSLAKDPSLRASMGERLFRKAAERFSLENTCRRQREIYGIILRRQTRGTAGRCGVTVCGAYGRGNSGDDAILEAIVAELREIDPDMPVWVMSRNPKNTRMKYRVNSVYTFNIPAFLYRMGRSVLFINGGGSLIQDVTSRRSLWFYLFTITAAKLLGNKVVMYGCGIGPLKRQFSRRLAAGILNRRVDIITLREPHSRGELEAMGVRVPKIILSADPTLILPPAPGDAVDSLFLAEGIPPRGEYICFSLRKWPGYEEKAPLFGAAADYAYETYGLIPVFLPIEPRIDVAAAKLAAQGMKAPHYMIRTTGGAGVVIGAFSRMRVVVSMRLHALVFAAGQGIPLVGVVYDHKISSFLSYIGQELFTDLKDVNLDLLKAHIDAAVESGRHPRELAEAVVRLREMEHRNSEAARELLGKTLVEENQT
ncbi:polysaccharide pyruvyl transferase CsaB [Papillibacter cinnamivorans]|uniref:Polysaccharide pyruvyl transferase CsaB n=1 Tax=Papillibacter cinnamivorans DSM 12816 TaxID=1122930 RepID=A0A1W1Z229_9FIRM|nr:polysaccharide pyruvyl transferase CsaB [Papillibacter cinnamivorans]SMC42537.1 polysaccharide pyruvyl transferase CsaB [Papillibacter cinnamivorans DSM 12816]